MPDLNLNSEAVREELEQVASFWLEKGADGFRLDAAKEYFTGYAEKNIEVLNWFETYVKSVKPEAYLVAEVWEGQGVLQGILQKRDSTAYLISRRHSRMARS